MQKHHSNWVALDFGALQTKPKHLDCWIGVGVLLKVEIFTKMVVSLNGGTPNTPQNDRF